MKKEVTYMSLSRRGQAALEFLSTYGFAFLIILVMVGALSYFGVLSPNKLIPNRCSFPPEVNCFEYQADVNAAGTATTLNVVLINQLGNTIDFNTTVAVNPGSNASSQFGYGACSFNPTSIANGQRTTLTCYMGNASPGQSSAAFPAAGEKIKANVDFQYRELGRTYWVPVRGELLTTLV